MNLLDAGLFHHGQGCAVIAVKQDKRPYRAGWNEYFTREQTEAEVREHLSNGAYGVAMVLWPASPYAVLDFDGKHAEQAWATTGIELPDTARNHTQSGWHHLYFRMPGGELPELKRKVRLVKSPCDCAKSCGVDLLVHGYAVIPPTPGYREDPDYPLEDAVQIPPEILALAQEKPRVETRRTGDATGRVKDGERNVTACSLAGSMKARGMSIEAIGAALRADNEQRFDPPLDDGEIEEVIKSASKWAKRSPLKDAGFVSSLREKSGEKKLLLQTWGDFVATDHGAAPFTIAGLAPDSGLVAFHGRGKGGKTTLLIHASRAVAEGLPFLERATVQKPVVYLNYEMGFGYLKELLTAGGPCPDQAYILNRPEPVLQVSTVDALMAQLGKPGLMVIDSFRGAFRLAGDGENSAGGAGLILRNIQDLAVKYKWLVVVVHHSNRGGREGTDGVSGTSDWIAAPDVIWSWSRPDKSKPGILSIEGRMPPVDPLAVDLSPSKCDFVGSVEETQERTDNKLILAALTEEGQTAGDIAESIGRPASTVRRRLEDLFEARQVSRDGEGKRGAPYFYSKVSSHHFISLGEETNRKSENREIDGAQRRVAGE